MAEPARRGNVPVPSVIGIWEPGRGGLNSVRLKADPRPAQGSAHPGAGGGSREAVRSDPCAEQIGVRVEAVKGGEDGLTGGGAPSGQGCFDARSLAWPAHRGEQRLTGPAPGAAVPPSRAPWFALRAA